MVVSILAADDLASRDESLGYGSIPEACAKLQLLPDTLVIHIFSFSSFLISTLYFRGDHYTVQTDVAPPTQNPIWNANLTFPNITGEDLLQGRRCIQIMLWDLCPMVSPIFLGECTVDLQKAFMDDRAVWYRLEDPNKLRSQPKAISVSPRGSIGACDVTKLIKRGDFNRSVSGKFVLNYCLRMALHWHFWFLRSAI